MTDGSSPMTDDSSPMTDDSSPMTDLSSPMIDESSGMGAWVTLLHFPKDTELVSVRVSYRISDYGDSPLLFETPDSIARLLRFSVDAGGASYLPVAVGNDYILYPKWRRSVTCCRRLKVQ